MRMQLMHKLLSVAGDVYSELSEDDFSDSKDLGREFFKYMKSHLLDDMTQKIKVSDFIKSKIMDIDSAEFDRKRHSSLSTAKKTKSQIDFITQVVTLMFKHSAKNDIIDW